MVPTSPLYSYPLSFLCYSLAVFLIFPKLSHPSASFKPACSFLFSQWKTEWVSQTQLEWAIGKVYFRWKSKETLLLYYYYTSCHFLGDDIISHLCALSVDIWVHMASPGSLCSCCYQRRQAWGSPISYSVSEGTDSPFQERGVVRKAGWDRKGIQQRQLCYQN